MKIDGEMQNGQHKLTVRVEPSAAGEMMTFFTDSLVKRRSEVIDYVNTNAFNITEENRQGLHKF